MKREELFEAIGIEVHKMHHNVSLLGSRAPQCADDQWWEALEIYRELQVEAVNDALAIRFGDYYADQFAVALFGRNGASLYPAEYVAHNGRIDYWAMVGSDGFDGSGWGVQHYNHLRKVLSILQFINASAKDIVAEWPEFLKDFTEANSDSD